ncbi:ABC transporter permease [Kitasatospora sp. NPDC089913]|uniref:ABC transporter permease n=1 Tax=Kitasatospora sp. NPDC089913 TaxID=3364080 RepID=UPI00381373D6
MLTPLVPGVLLLLLRAGAVEGCAVSSFFLPHPVDLAGAFVAALGRGALPDATVTALYESLAGVAPGTAVALPLGCPIACGRLAARALQPYLAARQAVPAVALAPLLASGLGCGTWPVVMLCAPVVFFPVLVNNLWASEAWSGRSWPRHGSTGRSVGD